MSLSLNGVKGNILLYALNRRKGSFGPALTRMARAYPIVRSRVIPGESDPLDSEPRSGKGEGAPTLRFPFPSVPARLSNAFLRDTPAAILIRSPETGGSVTG